MSTATRRGIRLAQIGMLVNTGLAIVKLVAGLVGHTYALVADAVESTADIFASLVVWSGLQVAGRDPDDAYPWGYGKAEVLAAAVVALMLMAAALGIAFEAVREIMRPHRAPAPWTLAVLVGVIMIKGVLTWRVRAVGRIIGSRAVEADASHHLSDAITSGAAFIGIAAAIIGYRVTGDPRWSAADDWAALLAAGVIAWNGALMLRPALADLMDRSPGEEMVTEVRRAAASVTGARVEKLSMRRAGMIAFVDIHVQADPAMSLHDAHALGGAVKSAIRTAVPQVRGVLVHMEPLDSRD